MGTRLPAFIIKRLDELVLIVCCALPALGTTSLIQARQQIRSPTDATDVVFAISFSPDSRTLAIARGAAKPSQRAGRIELWDVQTGELRRVIKGFEGAVWSVSFSPDGKTIVSGSSEVHNTRIQEKAREGRLVAELKWWDAQTGELKRQLAMPGDGRLSLVAAYSPDGKLLATSEYYSQSMIELVDDSGLFGARNPAGINSRSIGYRLAYGSDLKLLDADTGEVRRKLKGGLSASQAFRFGPFQRLAAVGWSERMIFSPDGRLLANWTTDQVKLWNTQTGEAVRTLKKFKGRLVTIAFSPDGHTLAVAITNIESHSFGRETSSSPVSEIRLYDVQSGNLTRTLTGRGDLIHSLTFAPDGNAIIIGSLQHQSDRAFGTIKLWDLKAETLLSIPNNDEGAVRSLVLSPNGMMLAFQSGPSAVKMLDTQLWKVKQTFNTESDVNSSKSNSHYLLSVKRVLAVAFSSDGNTVSGEIEGGGIKLWDPRTGEVKSQLGAGNEAVSMVAISSGGETLAEIHTDNTVELWEVIKGTKRDISMPPGASLSALAISADGQLLAVGRDKDVTLRNAVTGEVIQSLGDHQNEVNCLMFSADSATVASAQSDGTIKTWEVKSGRVRKTFVAGGKVTALGFSPSGNTLASASEDGTIRLWDAGDGALRQTLKKHKAPINAIAFSPDGQLLASGSDDRTVIIWETMSGKSKQTLKGHDLTVSSVAFSADGRVIASGSGNASVILWDVQKGKLSRILN